jgi:hypothetical protein
MAPPLYIKGSACHLWILRTHVLNSGNVALLMYFMAEVQHKLVGLFWINGVSGVNNAYSKNLLALLLKNKVYDGGIKAARAAPGLDFLAPARASSRASSHASSRDACTCICTRHRHISFARAPYRTDSVPYRHGIPHVHQHVHQHMHVPVPPVSVLFTYALPRPTLS